MLQSLVQGIVELPIQLQAAITLLVVFLVGWLFAQIAAAVPWLAEFLGKYKDQVAMAISAALITQIQLWLNLIPPGWEEVATIALSLVAAILIVLGVPLAVYKYLRSKNVRGFRK